MFKKRCQNLYLTNRKKEMDTLNYQIQSVIGVAMQILLSTIKNIENALK